MSRTTVLFACALMGCPILASARVGAATDGPLVVEPDGKPGPNVAFWLESSLKRIYPASPAGTNQPNRNWKPFPPGASDWA